MEERPNDVPDADEAQLPAVDWKKIRTKRRVYIVVLLLMIALTTTAIITGRRELWGARLALAIVFLTLFLQTAYAALHYPAWKLVLMGIAIFLIPFVALIVLGTVDRKIYDLLRQQSGAPPLGPISGLAYCSLVLCWAPVVGLVLSIVAVVRIKRSAGALRGMAMSIVALVISAPITGMCIVGLIGTLLEETP